MASTVVIATTSGALSIKSDLHPSVTRRLELFTDDNGSSRLLIIIGKENLNNAARLGQDPVPFPEQKSYASFLEFLQEWSQIRVEEERNPDMQ